MRWLALVVIAACYRHAPAAAGDGSARDASLLPDGSAPAGCSTYIQDACIGAAQSAKTLQDPVNTEADCTSTIHGLCLIAAKTITIDSHVHVVGALPLVLAADMIDITGSGDLDASSEAGGARIGAGQGVGCPPLTITATLVSGGQGGSFGTLGGNGGSGGSGVGGMAGGSYVPVTVGGGCPGSDGSPSGSAGGGGLGGGALWLFATQQLTVSGNVEVHGAGGGGGSTMTSGGGGGGGSGGMIALESPAIMLAGASLGANGGGGGAGSIDAFGGGPGNDGAFDAAAMGGTAIAGGSGRGGSGGNGGYNGGSGSVGKSGVNGTVPAGAGGGGGGEGWIFVHGPQSGMPTVISPPAVP